MVKGVDYIGAGVVFACHDGAGNFLFAKRGTGARDEHGMWEIPGGGIHYGETVVSALSREVKEELCTDPIKIDFMGYKDFIKKEGDTIQRHWIAFEFLVQIDPLKVKIGEPDKCDEIIWRSLDNPPTPITFGTQGTIKNILSYKSQDTI